MRGKRTAAENVDEYIAGFPEDVQKVLKKIRSTIKTTAPNAAESISYQIPAYKLDGEVLIYFAGFAKHVSIYPAPREAKEFKKELATYKGGKGTVQFPLGEKIDYDLIARIVKFKIEKIG